MANLAIIEGFLGADPELVVFEDGGAVANFSVATKEKWTDKRSGEKQESTEWHRVEVWNKRGRACAAHLKKGSRVYVQERLQNKPWEPAPGVKATVTIINVEKVEFL